VTAPINHKVAMLDALEVAANTTNYEVARDRLALAQVHATALVAEEQRLANLIALWTVSEDDAQAITSTGGFNFAKILDEIRGLVNRS
jgi:hypothetical protein